MLFRVDRARSEEISVPVSNPNVAPPAETGAAVTKVYQALRMPIVDGEIPPGERINIDAVARRLGVSQTPVREALQRLEGDDLLVYTPGRGYRTTPMLDLAGLRSVFEFRLLVEPWAARAAATDRLTNPSSALEEELGAFESVAGAKADVRSELLGHDTRFHDTILRAAGNEVVRSAYTQTHCHLHVFRLYPVDVNGAITIAEHGRIRDAIRHCDADEAERAMTEHITSSYARSSQAFAGPSPRMREPARDETTGARVVH
jgi:DNA-binding GntR family transcriptional regulator